jgi:hypothetical protein
MIADLILYLVAFAVGLPRPLGVTHPAYQATAHLFVGGLFGAWYVGRRPALLWAALALTALETACFLAGLVR